MIDEVHLAIVVRGQVPALGQRVSLAGAGATRRTAIRQVIRTGGATRT